MSLVVSGRRFAASVLVASSIVLLSGCSDVLAPTLPSRSGAPLQTAVVPGTAEATWTVVGSGKVPPGGHPFTVEGSRYTLQFSRGSVHNATEVMIAERDPNVIDVRFSPDGIEFTGTVTLIVDYSGSVNEASFRTMGMARLDPATGRWVSLPGRDDPMAHTYTVELQGFSRYALMDGPSSSDPPREMDPPAFADDAR